MSTRSLTCRKYPGLYASGWRLYPSLGRFDAIPVRQLTHRSNRRKFFRVINQKKLSYCSQDAQKPIAVPVRKLSVYLQPFRRSSFLECALQPNIAKINKKTPYFGSSGSFKVIDVDTTEKLVISACCDRQHAHGNLQPFSGKTGQQR